MIAIREIGNRDGVFSASVEINGGQFGPVEVRDPFAAESNGREARLQWYFEEWLRFPVLDQQRAAAAAASIAEYGAALFDQVFASRPAQTAYERWRERPATGRHIRIEGSPAFQSLHWEALRDPDRGALATEVSLVRTSRKAGVDYARFDREEAPAIRVLVVTARPGGARDVGYRTISRPLLEALGNIETPVEVDLLRPGTYQALAGRLEARRERPYHVVHFDLHGALMTHAEAEAAAKAEDPEWDRLTMRYGREERGPFEGRKGFLVFEPEKWPQPGAARRSDRASAQEVAELLARYRVPVAILNACQSGRELGGEGGTSLGAALLEGGAQNVLVMGYSVTVSAAAKMMPVLYRKLFTPEPLGEAVRAARRELANDTARRAFFGQEIRLQDWILPVLYQREDLTLIPRRMYPEELDEWFVRQGALRAAEPLPALGRFLGRDLETLEIERRLLGRNLLLIHGGGGSGKTTLLRHLAAWWQRTGWIRGAQVFSYEARAWTLEAILAGLAQKVLNEAQQRSFPVLSAAAQRELIVKRLRAERWLLVLDNLESVTAEAFAIRNELPEARREEIRDFLAALVGGESLVLLGSRGPVSWLARDAVAGSEYLLRGLDEEAASELAARVFAQAGIAPDLGAPAMRRLMRLLAGHPLALEVVLPNLARQSPEAVLEALAEGDVDLGAEGEDRTRSILACVGYSHSNLSPEAQRMLECLAPFKSALYTPGLPHYVLELLAEPALSDLPQEGWEEMLAEIRTWGLAQPHPEAGSMGYLSLQPTLPWFLERRLDAPERAETRTAIRRAFRRFFWKFAGELFALAMSPDAGKRQTGTALIAIEHETLSTTLAQALAAQERIMNFYAPLSLHYDRTRQFAAGAALAQKVIAALAAYPDDALDTERRWEMIQVLHNAASHLLKLRQVEAAREGYEDALRQLDALDRLPEEELPERAKALARATILHQLGMVAQKQRDWAEAEDRYRKALEINLAHNDLHSAASTYHQLGRVAEEQRDWDSAEERYRKALEIKLAQNDLHSAASTYHQLGRVAEEQRDWDSAEERYRKALEIYIDQDDLHSAAGTYHQLGIVAQERRDWDSAEGRYRKALEIKLAQNDLHSAASTYHQLGMVAEEQRDWAEAEARYRKALEIYIDQDDLHSAASTYHQLGMVAEEQRDWAEAEARYRKALEIRIRFKDPQMGSVLRSFARLADAAPERRAGILDSIAAAMGVDAAAAARALAAAAPGTTVDPKHLAQIRAAIAARLPEAWSGDWAAPPLPTALDWSDLPPTEALDAAALLAFLTAPQAKRGEAPDPAPPLLPMRTRQAPLPFWPGRRLLEIQIAPPHALGTGTPALATLVAEPDGFVLLDGTSAPIHAMNARQALDLAGPGACDAYLRFFCAHIRGKLEPFLLIDGPQDLALAAEADPALSDTLAAQIVPLAATPSAPEDPEGSHRRTGTVLHADHLFRVVFRITPDGMVEMLEDHPLAGDLPVRRMRYDGPLRAWDDSTES